MVVADSAELDITKTLTLAAWVKADTLQPWDGLIVKGTNTVTYGMSLNSSGAVNFEANYGWLSGGSGSGNWNSNTRVKTGQWHHVAVTYDGSHIRFYIDGQLDSNVVQANLTFATSNESLVLGGDFGWWFSL